jgi:hypothetical protein
MLKRMDAISAKLLETKNNPSVADQSASSVFQTFNKLRAAHFYQKKKPNKLMLGYLKSLLLQ